MSRTKKENMKNKHELYVTLDYLYDEGAKTTEYTKDEILGISKVIDILEDKYIE